MIDSYAGSDDAAVAIAGARAGADVVRDMYGRQLNRIDNGAGDFATAADADTHARHPIGGRQPGSAVP